MSFSEMLFLVFLALIVFGPKRLPEMARKLGKIMGEFRRASNDFRAQIEDEVRKLELHEDVQSIGATLKENVNTISRMALDQQILNPVRPVVKAATEQDSAERDSSFDTAAEAERIVPPETSVGALGTANGNGAHGQPAREESDRVKAENV